MDKGTQAFIDRHERLHALHTQAMKFTLQRVRLNAGGYDSSGSYWGAGSPLYWYCHDEGWPEGHIRAADRRSAKAYIRGLFPACRFYR
jgi:hypothetical protein